MVIDGRTRGTKIPRKASWRGGSTTPSVKHLVRGAAKKRVERVPKLVQQRLHLTTHMDTRHPVRAAPSQNTRPTNHMHCNAQLNSQSQSAPSFLSARHKSFP